MKSFLKIFVSLSEVSWDHPRATASGRLFLWAVRVSSVFRYTGNQLITPTTLQSAPCYCNKMHRRHAMEQDVLMNWVPCIDGWTLFESYIIIALVQQYIKHFLGESLLHKLPERGELLILWSRGVTFALLAMVLLEAKKRCCLRQKRTWFLVNRDHSRNNTRGS